MTLEEIKCEAELHMDQAPNDGSIRVLFRMVYWLARLAMLDD